MMFKIDWIQDRVYHAEYYFSQHGDQERQNDNLSLAEVKMKKCNFCGNKHVREAQVQYMYRHDEKFLVVNNVPCEQCEFCGEKYFKAQVLRNIEHDFNQIQVAGKKAKREVKVPVEEYFEAHKTSRKTAASA